MHLQACYIGIWIADILTKDKVIIPSAYAEIHYPENNHSSKKRGIEGSYFWTPTTVGYILAKREYMGHAVLNFIGNVQING